MGKCKECGRQISRCGTGHRPGCSVGEATRKEIETLRETLKAELEERANNDR